MKQTMNLSGITLSDSEISIIKYCLDKTNNILSEESSGIHNIKDYESQLRVQVLLNEMNAFRGSLQEILDLAQLKDKIAEYEPYAELLTLKEKGYLFILGFGRHSSNASDNGEYCYYAIDPNSNVESALWLLEEALWEEHSEAAANEYESDYDEEEEDEEHYDGDEPWLDYVEASASVVSLEEILDTMSQQYGLEEVEILK